MRDATFYYSISNYGNNDCGGPPRYAAVNVVIVTSYDTPTSEEKQRNYVYGSLAKDNLATTSPISTSLIKR